MTVMPHPRAPLEDRIASRVDGAVEIENKRLLAVLDDFEQAGESVVMHVIHLPGIENASLAGPEGPVGDVTIDPGMRIADDHWLDTMAGAIFRRQHLVGYNDP